MDILVIDNRAAQRALVEKLLKGMDYTVQTAGTLDAARVVLERQSSPVIIARWDMPEKSGVTLARWLRTTGLAEIRYLLFRVNDGQTEGLDLLRTVADDVLVGPLEAEELRARLAVGERVLRLESDLRLTASRLDKQVMIDELTGLMNRRALYRFSGPELARTRRNALPLSMLLINLDGFSDLAAKHGETWRDRALAHAAALLRNIVRPYDQIGRWADDQFLVILPDTESEAAAQVAERVLTAIGTQPVQREAGEAVLLKASVGLHTWHPGRGRVLDFDKLVREAERAMHRASKDGGNRVQRSVSGVRPRLAP
jgi:two-component system chemotaxis response regulator CheY